MASDPSEAVLREWVREASHLEDSPRTRNWRELQALLKSGGGLSHEESVLFMAGFTDVMEWGIGAALLNQLHRIELLLEAKNDGE